jgi:hypothetical protein
VSYAKPKPIGKNLLIMAVNTAVVYLILQAPWLDVMIKACSEGVCMCVCVNECVCVCDECMSECVGMSLSVGIGVCVYVAVWYKTYV